MTEFTARNGLQINRFGSLCGQAPDLATASDIHLARFEFYQHLRDTDLERWRWPLYPDYVVYSRRQQILVLNELTGDTLRARRDDEFEDNREGTIYAAALAYFEAHPERKPWDTASAGELWAFKTDPGTRETLWERDASESHWHLPGQTKAELGIHFTIVTGRKIWPEDAS